MLPPLLELYVLWHPRDAVGARVAEALSEHFHSPAYAGLAGGAVEVYVRSEGWKSPEEPPRPLALHAPLPHDLPAAQFTVILPLLGVHLARAAEDSPAWRGYLADIVAAHRAQAFVLPLRDPATNLTGSVLEQLFGGLQRITVVDDPGTLCREVAQATAQRLAGIDRAPLTVFVSHTKHASLLESKDDGPRIFQQVRRVIADTHLGEFFDARDLQPGDDWEHEVEAAAGRGAMLAVRTDCYSQREWTQREVLIAKRHEAPLVVLHALSAGDDRGSFLMDHVPMVSCDPAAPDRSILRALERLVDEALKRILWRRQRVYLAEHGFDWLPPHAPEPLTLSAFLNGRDASRRDPADDAGGRLWVIHPDPPLGRDEHMVLVELCALAGYDRDVEVLTPRTFASRGGRLP